MPRMQRQGLPTISSSATFEEALRLMYQLNVAGLCLKENPGQLITVDHAPRFDSYSEPVGGKADHLPPDEFVRRVDVKWCRCNVNPNHRTPQGVGCTGDPCKHLDDNLQICKGTYQC